MLHLYDLRHTPVNSVAGDPALSAAASLPLQFYKLTNSHSQISSYVFDVVRASVPKMNLDDVFLEKEAIARSIRNVRLQGVLLLK